MGVLGKYWRQERLQDRSCKDSAKNHNQKNNKEVNTEGVEVVLVWVVVDWARSNYPPWSRDWVRP